MRSRVTADELSGLQTLHDLSGPAIAALAAEAVVRLAAPGEFIFREGQAAHGIFVILAGDVRVIRSSSGRALVMHGEGRGGTLGEAPVFDGHPYPASAEVLTPVRCAYISRDALDRAIRAAPELAWFFLGRMAARVRTLLVRLESVETEDVTSRLVAYLLSRLTGQAPAIVAITQQGLAEELGTAREVVVRILRRLRVMGAIRMAGRGRIEILDRRALLLLRESSRHDFQA